MKRVITWLCLAVMLGTCCTAAAQTLEPRSSPTIMSRSAILSAGSGRGEVDISFRVAGTGNMTKIGVSTIKIYELDGDRITTIYGTTRNGLITSGSSIAGTYTYEGTPGSYYYAEVTVFAENETESDSKTITTNTIKAPS